MEPITVEMEREERSDIARRHLSITGAPTIEYVHQGYARGLGIGSRRDYPRSIQPHRISITWKRGMLSGFTVYGRRIKVDGTVGQLTDDIRFCLKGEGWQGSLGYGQPAIIPPDWLLQLVDAQKDNVPAFSEHG